MGKRRFALVATSDDEDEPPPSPGSRARARASSTADEKEPDREKRKRKRMKLLEEEEEEVEERKGEKRESEREDSRSGEEVEQEEEEGAPQDDAKPVGEPVRVSGKGRRKLSHYKAFEFDGNRYEIEDSVLLVPEDKEQKPYVAILKDITQDVDGMMMVTGQWFYRPEEAERKGGGSWQSRDTRELFYSFHRDAVPAESVLHKCVVHFIPIHKQLPNRKVHPGFIVQKVYDTVERKLWKLTDKDYEDRLQHEIDILVQKTLLCLGDIPDIETEDSAIDHEDQLKTKRMLRRKTITPIDVSRDDGATKKSDQHPRSDTPGSCTAISSEYYAILVKFKALTKETQRNKWMEKLLQGIQYVCNLADDTRKDEEGKVGFDGVNHENRKMFLWPDAAVSAVNALEKAAHDTLSSDFQKYNQKMRQLAFNLKNNALLARRLLNGELEPSKILNMSPSELKEGLTAEETATKEPEESERMQMTDARCSRCMEKKVGVTDIIQAGHGDRYQLECTACGYSWYASRDEASTLTIAEPSSARSVGTAPWATAKFEDVEKKFVSPRESEKSTEDVFKKTTEAYMPFLETQKSFSSKSKTESNAESAKNAE